MIALVRGEVADIGLDHAVVVVGGIGMRLHATPGTLAELQSGIRSTTVTSNPRLQSQYAAVGPATLAPEIKTRIR